MCGLCQDGTTASHHKRGIAVTKPTAGALTGAGFALASGTKYSKTSGTATAVADTTTGQVAITATTPGTPIAAADWAAHTATLVSLGLVDVAGHNPPTPAPNTVYYGIST
jgi:hypothetical protein